MAIHRKTAQKKPAKKQSPDAQEESAGQSASRPVWTGSISFGLLQIPVSLYTAEARQEEIHFHQLDKHDLAPIGYERVNKTTGKKVEWSDIVKGYEYEKGQYVVLSDEEIRAAGAEATQTVDIQDFVNADDIDTTYFETPYFLEPARKSQKAYALLREALRKQKKAAIATFVLRSREHLAAIFAREDALVLEVLRFADELRSADALALPPAGMAALKVHPKELEMAERLVEGMSGSWEPAKYRDTFRDQIRARIDEKVKTGKISTPAAPQVEGRAANVVDIMSLLRKSVERTRKSDAPKDKPAAAIKKAAPRRSKASGRAA